MNPRQVQHPLRFNLRSLLIAFVVASSGLWIALYGLRYRERLAIQNLEAAGAEVDFLGMTSSWNQSIWMDLMLDSKTSVRRFRIRYRDVAPGTLQNLRKLSEEVVDLSVGGSLLSDADLRTISQLKNLRRLRVGDWSSAQLSDNGLRWLSKLPSLRHLHINAPGITDAGIEHLSNLSDLYSLRLTNTGVTDAAMPHICRLKSLRSLGIGAPGITNASMPQLASLPELFSLDIRGASISDAGLDDIANCEELSRLYIGNSPVSKSEPITQVGLQQLRRRLPHLRLRR